MRIVAEKLPFGRGIELHMFDLKDNKYMVAEPPVMTERPNFEVSLPFAQFKTTEAQELMDSLWQCGLRPSEGSGSAGALAATQRHLDDMRTLVFKEK